MDKLKRNHSMDVLRVMAMLCIICHHCIVNDFNLQGDLRSDLQTVSPKQRIVLIGVNAFVIIGVNLFFLLSGYFQIQFKLHKFLGLIIQVYLMYGIVTVIGIMLGKVSLNGELIKNLVDPLDLYWYVMTYLLLMLVSPLLNILVREITQAQYKLYLLAFFVIVCGYGFVHDVNLHVNNGYSLLMAMGLYLVGAGIRKFNIGSKRCFGYCFLVWAVNGACILGIYALFGGKKAWIMYAYNNPFIVWESMLLVMAFSKCTYSGKRGLIVSTLAKGTLTIYLFHSTCWLTIYRSMPIKFMISNGQIWIAMICLPIYAISIYLVGWMIAMIYERSIGGFVLHILKRLCTKSTMIK